MTKHPDTEILDTIGRPALMEEFDVTRQTIYRWRAFGMPRRYRKRVAEMAKNPPSDPQDVTVIYAIIGSDDLVRYIGATLQTPKGRAAQHIHARNRVGDWMAKNLWSIIVLEVEPDNYGGWEIDHREMGWVYKMLDEGHPIMNLRYLSAHCRKQWEKRQKQEPYSSHPPYCRIYSSNP